MTVRHCIQRGTRLVMVSEGGVAGGGEESEGASTAPSEALSR
jgi:hypothetical protein